MPLLHLGALCGHWLSFMHWTHLGVPPCGSQIGVPASPAQSASVAQMTQRPPSQIGSAEGQSLFARHATHSLVLVSQSGVAPLQSELPEQPARQWKSCGSQIGCAAPQSEFERHCTHW